jgi:hypothetical protein
MGKVVFIGNCQLMGIYQLYQKFVIPDDPTAAAYVPSYADPSPDDAQEIAHAEHLVVQVLHFTPNIGDIESKAIRHLIPHVWAPFIWPQVAEGHIRNRSYPFCPEGPYPQDLSDRFLNRLIASDTPPDEAVKRYSQVDLSQEAERWYEISMDSQRKRDALCEVDTVSIIDNNIRSGYLFRTVNHPNDRIMRYLASEVFNRIGVSSDSLTSVLDTPLPIVLPTEEMPIHPSIIQHFGLEYVDKNSGYSYRYEGAFTFEEWMQRYMRFDWCEDLQHGMYLFFQNNFLDSAYYLRLAIHQAPRSSAARAYLAEALQRLGRLQEAAFWMTKAAAMDSENDYLQMRAESLMPFLERNDQV